MSVAVRSAGAVLAVTACLSAGAAAAPAADVTGLWLTDDGEGVVEIVPCGELRCGRIVWLKEPLDEKGRPIRDVNNPSPAERQRPLCGAQIIDGLVRQDDDSWDDGHIYDPEEGKTYSVILKTDGDGRLEVRGYMGIHSIGETLIWTRSAPDLKRCFVEGTSVPTR